MIILPATKSFSVSLSSKSSMLLFRWLFGVVIMAVIIGVTTVVDVSAHEGHDDNDETLPFEFTILDTTLPKPLSDHTATVVDGKIYLAGGCDATDGNVYNTEIGEFICDSISSSLYRYDPATSEITQLSNLPSERYRHAAIPVGNRIWLVGGRDVQDNLISRIDVYNIDTDTYTSFDDLPEQYWASDNTGFAHDNDAYVVGGYDATYETYLDTVYAIDTERSLSSDKLVIQDKAPLLLGRGDLSSVTNDVSTYAIVSGGFGPTLGFCSQVPQVELYNFTTGQWINIAPMQVARSDQALVELNGSILAFGGEKQVDSICNITGDEPEVAEQTLAVNDVEVLQIDESTDNDDSTWQVLDEDLPEHRFRFAAAALDADNVVYTFGGQNAYDETCQCYRTSNEIMLYRRHTHDDDDNNNTTDTTGTTTQEPSDASSLLSWQTTSSRYCLILTSLMAAVYWS